jgi:hypothetical protein
VHPHGRGCCLLPQVFDVSGEEVTAFEVDVSRPVEVSALAFRSSDDTLFVGDARGNRVLVLAFADAGTYSHPSQKCPAIATAALGSPSGLAIDGSLAFVCDTDNDNVHVFEENAATGSWKWQRAMGGSGARAGMFSSPMGACFTR